MRDRKWKLALVVLAACIAAGAMAGTAVAGCTCVGSDCYEDVLVTGASDSDYDGTYVFTGMDADGYPTYKSDTGYTVRYFKTNSTWRVAPPAGVAGYTTPVTSATTPPPGSWASLNAPFGGATVSGGGTCQSVVLDPVVVVPTGRAGDDQFLDRTLDLSEGQDPPMIGLLPLSAVYTIGEIVTGSCRILDAESERPVLSWVHVFIYAVDFEVSPEERLLLDHWMARHDWATREYLIEWETTGLDPGYYDLRLSFEDATAQTFRIELIPPVE